MRLPFLCVSILALILVGCVTLEPGYQEKANVRRALVVEIQRYEAILGWAPTENFHTEDTSQTSYRICYYTEEFSLTLHYARSEEACDGKPGSEFYESRVEALATIKTPLMPAMVRASMHRFVTVVFHEDFHEQIVGIPSRALDESAATLMGLLAARDFFKEYVGKDSQEYEHVASDVERYLESSRTLIRYHQHLVGLYKAVEVGVVGTDIARIEKRSLFADMVAECKQYVTFTLASCANATNNPRVGLMAQYALYYPLFYDLNIACGGDTKKTGLRIKRLVPLKLSEQEFVARVKAEIENGCPN